jgi:hypothetical protein
VKQRRRYVCSHALAERQLPYGLMDERGQAKQLCEIGQVRAVGFFGYSVDVLEKVEAVDDRKIPRELRFLAEHRTDVRHVFPALPIGYEASDLDRPAVGVQDSR